VINRLVFCALFALTISAFGQVTLTPIQSRSLANPAFTAKVYDQFGVQQGLLWSKIPGNYANGQLFGSGNFESHSFGGFISRVTAGASPYELIEVAGQYAYTVNTQDSSAFTFGITTQYGSLQLGTNQLIFSDQLLPETASLLQTSENLGPQINASQAVLTFGGLFEISSSWLASAYTKTFAINDALYGLRSNSRLNIQGGSRWVLQDKSIDRHHELIILYPEFGLTLDSKSDYTIGMTVDLDHLYGQNGVFYLGSWVNQELDFTNTKLQFALGLRQQRVSVQYSTSLPLSGLQSALGASHQIGVGLNIHNVQNHSYF
jgi:hypothetical protein